jgi:hypothetical protein
VVPLAVLADLNHVHTELTVFVRHRLKLTGCANASGEVPQLITKYIGQMRQVDSPAHRAQSIRCFTVVFGGTQGVGINIAQITPEGAAMEKRLQGSPSLKAVHHDRSL